VSTDGNWKFAVRCSGLTKAYGTGATQCHHLRRAYALAWFVFNDAVKVVTYKFLREHEHIL